jgi:predicted transposase/invertase (TIGR01784 family)
MDMSELADFSTQEENMALSATFNEAFLEWERQKEEEEGRQAALRTIALKLIDRQTPIAEVAEITGLSIEYIQQIQAEYR